MNALSNQALLSAAATPADASPVRPAGQVRLPAQRRGWCPSMWRPMASGDGLIVRLATGHRALRAAQAQALAGLAREHGNGLIEVTRRANVQLRGVTEKSLAPLQQALVGLGLASPRDAGGDLPLLVSPLAGLTPTSLPLEPIGSEVERVLGAWVGRLPSKFGVVVDAAGSASGVTADIRIELGEAQPGGITVRVGDLSDTSLGVYRSADAGLLVDTLLRALQAWQGASDAFALLPRMRDMLADGQAPRLRAGLAELLLSGGDTPASEARSAAFIGPHTGLRSWFGLAMPLGGDADGWEALAALAARFGSGELRVTPARGVLLPDVPVDARPHIASVAQRHGWVVDSTDPLLRVAACAGSPACGSGWGETRALAARLSRTALAAGNTRTLHVSGCAKGCAHSGPAAITLVHCREGARLAFGASAAEAAEQPAQPLARIERQLSQHPSDR